MIGWAATFLDMAKIGLLATTSALLLGCEDEGPFERAGEEIDEGIEDIRAGGETAGNQIDDAIDDATDAAEDAREELSE